MLKFSVVHVQPGPMRGDPVLYEPDHLSGIEEAHQYVGPMKFDSFFPYGGPGVGKEDEKEPKVDRKNKPRVVVKENPKIVAAVDFDLTLADFPSSLGDALKRAAKSGFEFHLVTGRMEKERCGIEIFCRRHGVVFSSMDFYPLPYRLDYLGRDLLMDARIGSWKAKRISELGATVAIDDNAIHIGQIVRRIPGIVVLKPVEV